MGLERWEEEETQVVSDCDSFAWVNFNLRIHLTGRTFADDEFEVRTAGCSWVMIYYEDMLVLHLRCMYSGNAIQSDLQAVVDEYVDLQLILSLDHLDHDLYV